MIKGSGYASAEDSAAQDSAAKCPLWGIALLVVLALGLAFVMLKAGISDNGFRQLTEVLLTSTAQAAPNSAFDLKYGLLTLAK